MFIVKKKWLVCLIMISVLTIVGCSNKDTDGKTPEEEPGYVIYYMNKSGTGLTYDNVMLEENDEKKLMGRLIEAMMNPVEEDMQSAINKNVKILDYSIVDKVAYINFSSAYEMQSKTEELLCRASFVLTLSQLEFVEYVGMNINGQPLMIDGTSVSLMKAEDFADVSANSTLKERDVEVKLYFANEKGDKLKMQNTSIKYNSNQSLERRIVDELIKGPSEKGYYRTLKEEVNVIEVFTTNRICYVYVDKSINNMIGVSEELMVYSLVNSLTELDYIDMVQIVIEGDASTKLNDSYSIAEPFEANYDIVESEEK
jgi:germination protein M